MALAMDRQAVDLASHRQDVAELFNLVRRNTALLERMSTQIDVLDLAFRNSSRAQDVLFQVGGQLAIQHIRGKQSSSGSAAADF